MKKKIPRGERHTHDHIARILVTTDMRSLENQSPLRETFVEFLQPSVQLGFFLIPVGVVLQWGSGRVFELSVNAPTFSLQSLREG
jgi:hypothetical protein